MNQLSEGFRTTGAGFQITFANGMTVSVQWHNQNSCSNYHRSEIQAMQGCPNAEVAVWQNDGAFLSIPELGINMTAGHRTPDDVARIIAWAVSQPAIQE